MSQKKRAAVILAAMMLAAAMSGCSSERTGSESAEEISSAAETEASETEAETEAETETVTEATTTVTETETLATETAAPNEEAEQEAASNVSLTHITEGGEGLGVYNEFSSNMRGEVMQEGSVYKNWKLDSVIGHAEADDTVENAAATFVYGETGGFSVNGTVEVLPADDPDYPNKMYFHSDDVDAFPKFMYDNRGGDRRAKFIIENSTDVYMLLDKSNPPEETAFSISVTVDSVTVRYAADGSAYDTIHVTAASNR